MGFTCGIVGLPNVGKSTIFNALTAAGAEAANYPFCTIEPNVGVVPVPDERLDKLAELAKSEKTIPTSMEFVDIAGLVKGASQGEGLGNQFLGHIRSVDAIAHVVRCFEDDNVTHVDGRIQPRADVETIDTELMLADLESVEKRIERIRKLAKGGDKDAQEEMSALERAKEHLDSGTVLRLANDPDFVNLGLITSKPLLFVANVSEDEVADAVNGKRSEHVNALASLAEEQGASLVIISGKVESELSQLDKEEQMAFLEEMGLPESGLDRLALTGYKLLELITFFTAGPKESRAWTCRNGAAAPQAAGRIHTDFEKGFIRAEVIGYDDFISCGGEHGSRDAGKLRVEGKDYIVRDGDVVHFRFNV